MLQAVCRACASSPAVLEPTPPRPTPPICSFCPPARREVYALWSDRLNWPEWFGMIEELGFNEEHQDVVALNMWYRWGERREHRVM